MSLPTTANLTLPRQSRRPLAADITSVLADWLRPGQANLLGLAALTGAAKHAERHTRRIYYARSFTIIALVLALVMLIGYLGHAAS